MVWEVLVRYNIRVLQQDTRIKDVWCVMQVTNLEDELCRCTDIKAPRELFSCKSNKEFKHEFIAEKRLFEKLIEHGFDYKKLWISRPNEGYIGINNDGVKIKRK